MYKYSWTIYSTRKQRREQVLDKQFFIFSSSVNSIKHNICSFNLFSIKNVDKITFVHVEQMQIKHATTKPVLEILCLHDWINGEKIDLRRTKFIENDLGGDMVKKYNMSLSKEST